MFPELRKTQLWSRVCLNELETEKDTAPARDTSAKAENEKELVILLSTFPKSPMAEPNEKPSKKGAKMIPSIESLLLWGIEQSREDI